MGYSFDSGSVNLNITTTSRDLRPTEPILDCFELLDDWEFSIRCVDASFCPTKKTN